MGAMGCRTLLLGQSPKRFVLEGGHFNISCKTFKRTVAKHRLLLVGFSGSSECEFPEPAELLRLSPLCGL